VIVNTFEQRASERERERERERETDPLRTPRTRLRTKNEPMMMRLTK